MARPSTSARTALPVDASQSTRSTYTVESVPVAVVGSISE